MEDELSAVAQHMGTSMNMCKRVYDSAHKECQAARQSLLINKMMTATQITAEDLEPATPGLYADTLIMGANYVMPQMF